MIIHRCLSHYSKWNMTYHSRQSSVDDKKTNMTHFRTRSIYEGELANNGKARGDWYHRILKLSQSSKL